MLMAISSSISGVRRSSLGSRNISPIPSLGVKITIIEKRLLERKRTLQHNTPHLTCCASRRRHCGDQGTSGAHAMVPLLDGESSMRVLLKDGLRLTEENVVHIGQKAEVSPS